ncbi:MAG: flagellin FliC [bacterium]|nr:flagellin FliC [bacterium]
MGITVNTNMQALRIQRNLNGSTTKMNAAMERMSSGFKINKAKDDAAGYAVAATLGKTISGSNIAKDNVSMGDDLLTTTSGTLTVVQQNLQRIRDLTEQAANGTYSTQDLKGIASEVRARLEQIDEMSRTTTFNGKKLLDGSLTKGIDLQIGTESGQTINLSSDLFATIDTASLSNLSNTITAGNTQAISGFLDKVDKVVVDVIERLTDLGAASNRLEAISDSLVVQVDSLTSALSTVKDADIAEESANYVQQQILQSASATLLTQANSAPEIALQLIQG